MTFTLHISIHKCSSRKHYTTLKTLHRKPDITEGKLQIELKRDKDVNKTEKSFEKRLLFTTAILLSTKGMKRLRKTKNSNAEKNSTVAFAGTGLMELNST